MYFKFCFLSLDTYHFIYYSGIRHVSEIADLALDLVEQVTAFRIPHRPERNLEIRAGMNSGPCVAGEKIMYNPFCTCKN